MVETGGVMYNEEIQEYMAKMIEKSEAFFAQAGKKPMEVYRIEKFEPVHQPEKSFGDFHEGDSYVVVKHQEVQRCYDIHFWHGKDATADEMGSAAALSVQLSDRLPLMSRHHLELMNEETDLFMSYFKAVTYLPGGIESGFRKVRSTKEFEPRLMLIKGKRYPRVHYIPMEANQINEGDCFVLDMNENIYYWIGQESNYYERLKALEIAVAIRRDERMNRGTIHYPRDMGGKIEEDFWNYLGGRPDKINPAVPDSPAADEATMNAYRFWHVSDDTGTLVKTEITERPLKATMLSESDSYILELYDTIYCWQGKHASISEKRNGMAIAKSFVADHGKPKGTHVTRMPQGCEDALFKSYFEDFYAPVVFQSDNPMNTQATQDMSKVAQKDKKAAELTLAKLGGSFEYTLYRLSDDLKTPEEVTGAVEKMFLFDGDCYVVDVKGPAHRYLLLWSGWRLGGDQMSKAGLAMDKLTGGEHGSHISRVQIQKGREDESFMQFFKLGLIILSGKHRPLAEWKDQVNANGSMFRIASPNDMGTKAVEQTQVSADMLNSGDTFIVVTPGLSTAYLWRGSGSCESEYNCGTSLLDNLKMVESHQVFNEGEEPEEFWTALGGKGEYSREKIAWDTIGGFEPRLFNVSNSTGFMWVKEIPNFTQEDLLNTDVFFLDAYHTIFIWIGRLAEKQEVTQARVRAEQYLESVRDNRNKDEVAFVECQAGHSPYNFRCHFIQWSDAISQSWIDEDPLEKLLAENRSKAAAEEEKANNPFAGFLDPATTTFTYEEIKGKFPKGIKGNMKEYYLSDAEFQQVLGMTKEEWGKLKLWKQEQKKQDVGIF